MNAPDARQPADALLEQVRRLQDSFDAKIRYDEVRERLVESMSEELAAHREGLYQLQLRPILLDLIAMYDDLSKVIESADSQPETVRTLAFFRDTIEQTLARNGVERFTVEGCTVDRARQKIISVVETADSASDREVAGRLRPGFSWNGRVLRPEWVSAYLATSPAARATLPAASGASAVQSLAQPLDPPPVPQAGDGATNRTADPIDIVPCAAHADEGVPS